MRNSIIGKEGKYTKVDPTAERNRLRDDDLDRVDRPLEDDADSIDRTLDGDFDGMDGTDEDFALTDGPLEREAGPFDPQFGSDLDYEDLDSFDDDELGGTDDAVTPFSERNADGSALLSGTPTHDVASDRAPLFAATDSADLRTRWMEIQTRFVDEPRQSVQDADALVAEVTERLTAAFTRNRDELERQWTAGGEVSTEDLRRTLQRYRTFFERLLSV